MATPLKSLFNAALVRGVGADLRRAWPKFDRPSFETAALARLDDLELTARARAVADALHAHLPPDFEEAVEILTRSLGPELTAPELNGFEVFRYLPHVFWVSTHGLGHPDAALRFQYEVTKRFSAEFSLRAFVERHPEKTLEILRRWARDPNVHVRRLVSEGTRPRLPWAPRLRMFQKDPSKGLELLELLKDDPELYVRRSVANHLNDISKDHPERAVQVANAWARGADENRRWVIRHALRDLVKKGHPGALAVMGAGARPEVDVRKVRLSAGRVRRGDALTFTAELVSRTSTPQELLVDFAVHFVKADGTTAPKVFKLTRLSLPAKGAVPLSGRVSFRPMTTRRLYPGRHALDLRVNGVVYPLADFQLR
jgi:3-methyladenine DNA glycosylase AlkC